MRPQQLAASLLIITLLTSLGCSASKEELQAPSSAKEQAYQDKASIEAEAPAQAQEGPKRGLGPSGPEVLIGKASRADLSLAKLQAPTSPDDASALLVAIDTPYQIFEGQGSYIHVAAWRTDGQPAYDADVFVGDAHMGSMNEHGTLVFIYPPPGKKSGMIGANAVTVVDRDDPKRRGAVPFSPSVRTASFASDQLFVYTDRGIYRPGDLIRVRMLAWHLKEDYRALANEVVEIVLTDPQGKTVGGGSVKTDATGIASLDLSLPNRAPDGVYKIAVSYKQARQEGRLQVRSFKSPVLTIKHSLPRFITTNQQSLSFDVDISTSQGKPVESSDVKITFEVNQKQPLTLTQKVKGPRYTFTLTPEQLKTLKDQSPLEAWIIARISVTDSKGRTDETTRELRHVLNPYTAVLEADKSQYTSNEPVTIIARARDLDGVPLRHKRLMLKSSDGKTYQGHSDDKGTAKFSFIMPARSITVTLHTDGVNAQLAERSLPWVASRPMVSKVDEPILKERQKTPIRVRFPENFLPAERVVHLDVVDTSGAIVQSVLLPIEQTEQGPIASGEFEAPTWGSMLVTLFALGRSRNAPTGDARTNHMTLGLLTEGQDMVVHPNRELDILLDGVPDEAAPGERLSFKPRVRTPQGREIDAAVGVALVDERVLALRDPLEVTPMDHLYSPTLRTMSTTGAQILSWPVVSRNWGSRQHDVALPPFPFLEGGPIKHATNRGDTSGLGYEEETMPEESDAPPPPPAEPSKEKADHKPSDKKIVYEFEDDSIDGELTKPKSKKPVFYNSKPKVDYLDAPQKNSMKVAIDSIDVQGKGGGQGVVKANTARPKPAPQEEAPPEITIRTNFTDTSLWLPSARAGLGVPGLEATLPDAIAPQTLLVVASDNNGGVGVKRHTIQVKKALWSQLDVPGVMRAGDAIDVPVFIVNDSNQARDLKLSLTSADAQLTLSASTLKLAPYQQSLVMARIKATSPGTIAYTFTASDSTSTDQVHGTFRVISGDLTRRTTQHAEAQRDKPATLSWETPRAGAHAQLSVAFPSFALAATSLQNIGSLAQEDPLSLASDLVTASLLLQYTQREDIQSPAINDLKQRVIGAIGDLTLAQNPDGSYSYWRNGKSGAFITAWVLEGLLEAQNLDLPVKQDTIRRAADWLADQIGPNGLVDTYEIAFWEGSGDDVRRGTAAEVFHVLSLVPEPSRSQSVKRALDLLTKHFEAYLKTPTLEPLATGRALLALAKLKRLDKKIGEDALRRLLATRQRAHWEPTWFHAWGGMVELNTSLLVAMHTVNPAAFATERRDLFNWIMSTQHTWGQWHHERDTAAALRAILLAGSPNLDPEGTIDLLIDGKPWRSVKINAKDPFLTALELSSLELPPLPPGAHSVEVRSTSGLPATVTLIVDAHLKPAGSSAQAAGHSLTTSASLTRGAIGQRATMNIKVARPKDAPSATLSISRSGLLDIDLTSLIAAVVNNPRVARYSLDTHALHIQLAPATDDLTLAIPVSFARSGEGSWPAVSLSLSTPGAEELVASAGKITISP